MANRDEAKKKLDDLFASDFEGKVPGFSEPAAATGTGGKKPPPGGPPKPPAGTPKKPESSSGGPKDGSATKHDQPASSRTPEQAEADKTTLRRIITELKTDLGGSMSEGTKAIMQGQLKDRERQLEEILKQFPDSGQPNTPDTASVQQEIAVLRKHAKELGDAGKPLADRADQLEKQLHASSAKPATESPKPAEAAKPAEVKLTPEQQVLTDQVTAAAWLKPDEKNNFNAAIKGAKDPAELQRIEHSMNVLRDL